MQNSDPNQNLVQAGPTKRFFVEMLTRDIDLQDAILDLLDNCVDGILRSINEKTTLLAAKEVPEASLGIPDTEGENVGIDDKGIIPKLPPEEKPYYGFRAEIKFAAEGFEIIDNCGGIPLDIAIDKAFMMGRPPSQDEGLPTVGMYGIGMKRAMFKMGRHCTVKSYTEEIAFEVIIDPEWMKNDKSWDLQFNEIPNDQPPGTHIIVKELVPNISEILNIGQPIHDDLPKIVGQHFSFIIEKGFEIVINGTSVKHSHFGLIVSPDGTLKSDSLAPYIYKANIEGVDILLAIGFYRQMIDATELDEEAITKRTSADAGWTIVCNDRVVLYNDKSILTGWGEAGVPTYHTQFIGIRGVVFFYSHDPLLLPLTTTKRGVEMSSKLYLYIKGFMREGLKKFTDYTNQWKVDIEGEKKNSAEAKPLSVKALLDIPTEGQVWINVRHNQNEKKLNLPLAKPVETDPFKQIKFNKRLSEIQKVSEIIFGLDQEVPTGKIGEACFDHFLNKGGRS